MPEIQPPAALNPPSIVDAGLKGLCPRCGAPTAFVGPIKFAKNCTVCGLDIDGFNVGDGPAAFLTLIIGAIICLAAIIFELTAHPPFWVHIMLWPPITVVLVVGSLRVAKGMLLASEYRNHAREGRIAPIEPPAGPGRRDT